MAVDFLSMVLLALGSELVLNIEHWILLVESFKTKFRALGYPQGMRPHIVPVWLCAMLVIGMIHGHHGCCLGLSSCKSIFAFFLMSSSLPQLQLIPKELS